MRHMTFAQFFFYVMPTALLIIMPLLVNNKPQTRSLVTFSWAIVIISFIVAMDLFLVGLGYLDGMFDGLLAVMLGLLIIFVMSLIAFIMQMKACHKRNERAVEALWSTPLLALVFSSVVGLSLLVISALD